MDDFNILHMDEKEMLRIIEWMKIMCDKDMLVKRLNKYDCLGMDLNLSIPWEVRGGKV